MSLLFLFSALFELHATDIEESDFNTINLSNSAFYYLDDNQTLDFEGIAEGKYNSYFIKNTTSSISPAYTKKTLWVKFSVTNQGNNRIDTILNLPIPWINQIEAHILKNATTQKYKMGIVYPFGERPIVSPSYCNCIDTRLQRKSRYFFKSARYTISDYSAHTLL